MTHTRFLKIALTAILLPAIIVLLLPEEAMKVYVDIIEPVALLAGSFLALWVSFSYQRELKAAFIFLSVFLLVYALAIILFLDFNPLLVPVLESRLVTADIYSIVTAVQFMIYAVLLFFCINLLRAVNVTRLNRNGWILFGVTTVFCLLLAIYPVKDTFQSADTIRPVDVCTFIMRLLDALLIIVLVPVLWQYVQYQKSQQRQSLTFTVIIFGIVCALIFDYLFQMVITLFPGILSEGSMLYTSIREALFIYGYLIIDIGLYAHRKQDEWGFQAIDKIMSGELKLLREE